MEKNIRYCTARARSCWTYRDGFTVGIVNFLFIWIFVLSALPSMGQQITKLQAGSSNDSSYYHLTKINDNEYWACGEGGIITRFDTLGHFQALPIRTEGYNILKVERFGDVVILATDNARIMKYHLTTGLLTSFDFPKYKHRCFYDFQVLPDGKIILCGGTTGISMGKKKIPHGFIAITDTSLTSIKKIWKCYRKFVWSLLRKEDGTMIASVFNGLNTTLLATTDMRHWKTYKKIKGLIHEIKLLNSTNQVTYVGTGNIHYGRTGMYNLQGEQRVVLPSSGCIWSQEMAEGYQVLCGEKGQLFLFHPSQGGREIQVAPGFALYDLKFISHATLLVVGHGKCACLVQLK